MRSLISVSRNPYRLRNVMQICLMQKLLRMKDQLYIAWSKSRWLQVTLMKPGRLGRVDMASFTWEY
ncbi:hypothetical protein GBA52_017362 [Prunus armeniaca]|nr:hypothetical protein GBA52_017362 [Prunus armeniaca]